MHRAAYHFIKALDISSTRTKIKARAEDEDGEAVDEADDEADDEVDTDASMEDDEADIDVSMDVDASADDPEAMQATTEVDFDPGDTLGKLLAFVNQVRMSSEGVCEFLAHACAINGVKPIELRLWVRTRWGSLSDCLEVTLGVRKVCSFFCSQLFSVDTSDRQLITFVFRLMGMKTSRL